MHVVCPKCAARVPIDPTIVNNLPIAGVLECVMCDEYIALAKREDSQPGVHAQLNTACDKQWFMDRYGDWWEVMWVLSSCGLAG